KIVIQTGGAQTWQNDIISADKLQRYVYDENGLSLVDEQPSASMGAQETLEGFLSFAKENYPAKRTAVTLWNHGGGSVTGASFDELYDMDSLDLSEMKVAFTSVFGEDKKNQPVDIIGFDTCLMATVDVADVFSGIGKYLVASEEVEPGNGWLYSGWLGEIAENPYIEPLELSQVICDTYVEGCEMEGTEENITLSVTNLSKVGELVDAYDEFGKEALACAAEDPSFFTYFSKVAGNAENYGGNTREQGFTNMADLGDLARGSVELLPETSNNVISSLEDCVEYKVNGKYRQDSTGLACYFSYNCDYEDFMRYTDVGSDTAFKYLYAYGLTGELPDEGLEYL
ncbi:MAG: clostripain-related cysteine peptidase, partial [Oscillospiraceae bacterium]